VHPGNTPLSRQAAASIDVAIPQVSWRTPPPEPKARKKIATCRSGQRAAALVREVKHRRRTGDVTLYKPTPKALNTPVPVNPFGLWRLVSQVKSGETAYS